MRRLHGFSLMEMMIVLTIVAVVAAASAPMVNKKLVRGASEKSPWVFVNGESIGYNIDNEGGIQDRKTATIGTNGRVPSGAGNPRLYIDTNSDTTPHILFGRQRGNLMRMIAGGEKNSVWLSSAAVNNIGSSSVTVGPNARATDNNSIAIGNNAQATSVDSISIGKNSLSDTEYSIAIGQEAKATDVAGVAIGSKARAACTSIGINGRADAPTSIALLGTTANAANNSIAIGESASAGNISGIALGLGSRAAQAHSIALGANATTRGSNTIAIGHRATVGAAGGLAIGRDAFAATNAIAIGHSADNGVTTQANSTNSVAIGYGSRVSAINGMALGVNARVNAVATNSVAIGREAIADRHDTIVLGDRNTTVIIPGAVEFQNLVVRGNANIVQDLYVGGRTVLGLRLHGYKKRLGDWKGDTSLVWGSYTVDDNNHHKWVHAGGNDGHGNYQFAALCRVENEHAQQAFLNADRYSNESSVNVHGDITNITRNAFRSFYQAIGESLPSDFPSDRRLKNVGKEFTSGLEKLKKLDLYNYTYKADKDKTPHVGVMAQDLQKIFPDAVVKGEDGFLRIRLEDMFYAVINAVKELDNRTSAQEKKIKELEKRIEELEKK